MDKSLKVETCEQCKSVIAEPKELMGRGESVQNPKCFKCDAEVSKFLVWTLPTAKGNMVLLFCNECGAVQGAVRE